MNVQLENIPDELKARPQWVTHKKKIPFNPRTGKTADTTDPTTWATFDEAWNACQRHHHAGIGYVFSPDDPFVGIDLDKCRNADTGAIDTWAQDIIATMQSYSEQSPSGTGVHIFVVGDIAKSIPTKQIEVYNQERYFTVTGQQLAGTPSTIRSVNGELTKLCESLRPAPRPKVERAYTAPEATVDADHARRYALAALRDESAIMRAAGDGERHNQRIKSAYALAGYIPHIIEDEITDALAINFGENEDSARKTIADGIAAGKDDPRIIPPPREPDRQFAGRAAEDLDDLDPATLRSHLRDVIADRDRWKAKAEHLDEWRAWTVKVAAIPTEKLSPAAKVTAIGSYPEMKSRASRGISTPMPLWVGGGKDDDGNKLSGGVKDAAGLSADTAGAKLKELATVGALERKEVRDAKGHTKVLIGPGNFFQPETWAPPAPRNHGGERTPKSRPAPACPEHGSDAPVLLETTIVEQPICGECETSLGDPKFAQKRTLLWEVDTDPDQQLAVQERTDAYPVQQVAGRLAGTKPDPQLADWGPTVPRTLSVPLIDLDNAPGVLAGKIAPDDPWLDLQRQMQARR